MQEDRSESRDNHMSSTLVIMRFDEPLAGEYTCVASNVFRMKKRSIVIRGTYTYDVIETSCITANR